MTETKPRSVASGKKAIQAKAIRDAKPKRPGKGGGKAPAKDDAPPSKPAPPIRHPALVAIDTAMDLDALGRALTAANADTSLTDKDAVGAAYQKRRARIVRFGDNLITMDRIETMTPKEAFDLSVRAGIHNPDGTLTPEYGGPPRQLSLVDEEEDYGEPEPDEPTVSTVLPGESEAALLLTQLSERIRPLALQGRLDEFRVALAALLAEWSDP